MSFTSPDTPLRPKGRARWGSRIAIGTCLTFRHQPRPVGEYQPTHFPETKHLAESKPIEVTVSYEGRTFPFQLHRRQLTFGAAGQGDYYWMDGRQLRRGQGGPNFRPGVDLWWHAVEQAGDAGLTENLTNLVLAECYPLVNTSKGMQDVFVDAHLHATADREYSFDDEDTVNRYRTERTFLLPDDECARLRDLAHSRRLDRIGQELDGLVLGWLPEASVLSAYQQAAREWIGGGIQALRTQGRGGLRHYTETIDTWITKYRRRGGQEHARHFVNVFSYECKAAFYLCYASAWVALLAQLVHEQRLNAIGRRFIELWHNQNRVDHDETGPPRDVFRGQILALHPLSAIAMTSPEHLTVIGKWIDHPDYGQLQATGRVGECPAYWDLVATILIAAHEYRASHVRWDESQGAKPAISTPALEGKARDDATASAAVLFEDFVSKRGITCPVCEATLQYDHFEPVPNLQATVTAHYVCSKCDRAHCVQVTYEELQKDDKDS